MATKSRKYTVATCEDVLYQIYYFVVSSGQTAVRLVNDTGSAVALYSGGVGFVASWASSANCPDGSYMIVEPVTACGSDRWQMYFVNASGNTMQAGFAPRGGWTNAAANFGTNPVQPDVRWNDANDPGAGSQLYIATGTFAIDGSNTGTYLWANIKDTGSSSADQFTYGGNYYPWDISYDTRPCCFLARVPTVDDAVSSLGRNSSDGNNLNRTSVEVAQTTSWASAGYARIGLGDTPAAPGNTCIIRDKQGKYPPLPAYLFTRNTSCDGHFGDHLRLVSDSLTDYDVDDVTTPTRLVIGHLWLHFDTSL